jgi:hypothetical protein
MGPTSQLRRGFSILLEGQNPANDRYLEFEDLSRSSFLLPIKRNAYSKAAGSPE